MRQAFGGGGENGGTRQVHLGQDAASPRHGHQVPREAETRDIRAGMGAVPDHQRGGFPVQRRHPAAGLGQRFLVHQAQLRGEGDDACAERFGQYQQVARLRPIAKNGPAFARYKIRRDFNQSRDGKAKLDFLVIDAVAADKCAVRLVQFVHAAPQDRLEDRVVQGFNREADDGKRRDGPPAHGVDVADGIGCGDLAEKIRVVHAGSEDIHGLYQRKGCVQPINAGIVARCRPHQDIGIGHRW
ncbi:MAG: hypothetical protein BWY09_00874 [Candidatus Hydrogenedentes bacterium ADurb.Bin179]|nr:MAG: hypothetical protein BWY09_00874 [Candidatus Hydrogenedentes bacterium ADurb.Bin179]